MNQFVNAVNKTPNTTTTNGAAAFKNAGNALVDLYYNMGSSRGVNTIVNKFVNALQEDGLSALKLMFHCRDVRGGMGERETFRKFLLQLAEIDVNVVIRNIHLIPFYGRWDDGLVFVNKNSVLEKEYFSLIKQALANGDKLCAKWMPREKSADKEIAIRLMQYLEMTPKQYRKMLSTGTEVVEQLMCAKQWDQINFSHVPSVAAARYQKAFNKNATESYAKYKEALNKGEAKVNASAVFPHDVVMSVRKGGDNTVANAQWESLPNYMNGKNVLPMIDVSSSMNCAVGGNANLCCIDVSVAIGMYASMKQTGAFKNMYLTFHSIPSFGTISGKFAEAVQSVYDAPWGGSTNFEAAMMSILTMAVQNKVPSEDMPEILLILSDMQFNRASTWNKTLFETCKQKFESAGYKMPIMVFWNLNASYDNSPVKSNTEGAILLSGFSPAVLKSALSAEIVTPFDVVMDVINSERYAQVVI